MNALALCLLLAASSTAAEHRQYALVVGNNLSVDPGVKPLRYADDDAARWAELLGPLSARLELLAVFDAETQALHPGLVRVTVPPTAAALDQALARLGALVAADHAAGREATLFFVFVGHGGVGTNREGYVSLLDGRFTRTDLYEKVVRRSGADYLHLVVDACNAYLLVNRRGGEAEFGPAFPELVRSYVDEQDLERWPQVGVLLSTSGERESHEWSGFRAGVFSHEVRSGLAGAADVNRDGRIEYSELKAFVAAANVHIADPRARPEIWARPPARDRSRPLVDLGARGFDHFLLFPASFSGQVYLEDGRGVRFADFHKAKDRTVAVALPDQPLYYLRTTEDTEARVVLGPPGLVDVGALTFQLSPLASRGSIAQSLTGTLFAEPFGAAFYRGFVATSGDLPVAEAVPLTGP